MKMMSLVGVIETDVDTDGSGHVTALTVSPTYRRMGLARRMMEFLEQMSDIEDCFFVDLYVRKSNTRECSFDEPSYAGLTDRGPCLFSLFDL